MAKVHRIHSLPDESPWDGGLPPEGSAEHPRTIRALDRVLQVQRTWIEGVQLLIKGLFLYLNGNPLYPRRITKVACMHRAGMGGQHPISWSHPLELAFQDLLGYVFNQGVT